MKTTLFALAGLVVLASPALSQSSSRWDDRDDRDDRGRSGRDYSRWHDMGDHGGRGGAAFRVRSGDSDRKSVV